MQVRLNEVSVAGLRESIRLALDLDLPLLIEGKPGIGKSEIVRQAAQGEYAVLDRRVSQMLPEDMGGIPLGDFASQTTVRCMPDLCAEAHRLRESSGMPVLLFLDEINTAPRSVLATLYEVVLDRRCGGFSLPPGTRIIAAGNPPGTGAAVEELPRPLTNRMAVISFAGPTIDEWEDHALRAGVMPEILTALRVAPDFLHARFDPEAARNPTPRAWVRASGVLSSNAPSHVRMAMLAGVVGDEAAAKVAHVMDCASRVYPSRSLLAEPDRFGPHADLAMALLQAFALAGAVSEAAQTRTAFAWLERHHPEVLALFVKRLMARVEQSPDGASLIADVSLLQKIHKAAEFVAAGDYLRRA
jgi:hypothetical protein